MIGSHLRDYHGLVHLSDDQECFRRAKQGDLEALETIYDRCKGSLYAYLVQMTRDEHEAEDLLVDTFYRFIRAMHRYRDTSDPRALLFRTAKRLARRWQREQGRTVLRADPAYGEAEAIGAAASPDPAQQAADAEDRRRLLAAAGALSPRLRSVFELVDLSGLSYEDAAVVLGMRPSAVRRAAARARAALIAVLNAREDPDREGRAGA